MSADLLVQPDHLVAWGCVELLRQCRLAGVVPPKRQMAVSLLRVTAHELRVGVLPARVDRQHLLAQLGARGEIADGDVVIAEQIEDATYVS